jgi:energy-coupling factor transport system permease protein
MSLGPIRRPTPTSLFVYALTITLLAFAYRSMHQLAIIAVPNILLGFILGFRRLKILFALLLISVLGTFLNALITANRGQEILSLGFLVVKAGALEATLSIGLRLMAIAGSSAIFYSLTNPREAVKDLESELGIPPGPAFSLLYTLRLLPLMQRDFREIQLTRLERGYRKIPITATDVKSVLLPLLSVGLRRALWAGIIAELRGLSSRRTKRRIVIGLLEYLLLSALLVQLLLSFLIV